MALIQRTGTYGQYWGDEFNSSHTLNTQQQQINATYIWMSLSQQGWSLNAVARDVRKYAK